MAAATAAIIAAEAANKASQAAASAVSRTTGGQGGTVLLIGGIIVLGYLFVTKKLQRVIEVIREPAGEPLRDRLARGELAFPGVTPKDAPKGTGIGRRIDKSDDEVYVNVKPKPEDDKGTKEQEEAAREIGWPPQWRPRGLPKGFYVQ